MATIMLYANKANQMPGLVQDVKKSILDYKKELFSLKNKLLNIDQSTCNMEDVVSSIQAATRVQEEKIASLEALQQNSERFVEDAARIDGEVADIIRQRKDDFYEQYSYLKPECEKNIWEKFCDGCKKFGEWCKEHWTTIVAVVLIVVVITIAGAWGPFLEILAAACQGLLVGTVIGGLMGGLSNIVSGRPFLEGFKDGALLGALMGAFFGGLGGLGGVLGSSCKIIGFLGPVAKALPVISKIFTRVALGMFGFDLLSLGISLFSPDDQLVQLNRKLHSSKPYNAFQFTVTALAAFSSGFVRGWAEQRPIEGGTDVWDMTEGGGVINGREYSQHAMERMAPDTPSVRAELSRRAEALAESKGLQVGTHEYYQFCQKYVDPRNIPPSVIEDAIRNTTAVPGHTAGTFVHQTADVTVIVNETGKVITVIPK